MGELLPSRHRQQGVSGTRQLHSDAVAPVVAVQVLMVAPRVRSCGKHRRDGGSLQFASSTAQQFWHQSYDVENGRLVTDNEGNRRAGRRGRDSRNCEAGRVPLMQGAPCADF